MLCLSVPKKHAFYKEKHALLISGVPTAKMYPDYEKVLTVYMSKRQEW